MSEQQRALTPVDRLKKIVSMPSVQEQFNNALKDKKDLFIASLIDVYANDSFLQKCEPKSVVMESLKAATLNLPINKSLGFAYIVPYKGQAQCQIGYKGFIQLAQRTGKYRFINADAVFEGELKGHNKLTGEIDLSGTATSDKVIGYFAYIELLNGFSKCIYWTKNKVEAHAKRYSQSYNSSHSPWKSNFDEMALKTVLKQIISHYGIMTVEMTAALNADEPTTEATVDDNINAQASEPIDITPTKSPENEDQEQLELGF